MTTQEILSKYQELERLDMSIGDSHRLMCTFFGYGNSQYEQVILTDYDFRHGVDKTVPVGTILVFMKYRIKGILYSKYVLVSHECLQEFKTIADLIKEIGLLECK